MSPTYFISPASNFLGKEKTWNRTQTRGLGNRKTRELENQIRKYPGARSLLLFSAFRGGLCCQPVFTAAVVHISRMFLWPKLYLISQNSHKKSNGCSFLKSDLNALPHLFEITFKNRWLHFGVDFQVTFPNYVTVQTSLNHESRYLRDRSLTRTTRRTKASDTELELRMNLPDRR